MRAHHVHAKKLAGIDHVLAIGPQRCGGSLPGVATIKEEGLRSICPYPLDQRGQMRKSTHLAESARGLFEIEIGGGMRHGGPCRDAIGLEQGVPHQMRHLAAHAGHPQIHTGLAKIDRRELRMTVGEVHDADIAKLRNVIELVAPGGSTGRTCPGAKHSAGRTGRHDIEKLASIELHDENL